MKGGLLYMKNVKQLESFDIDTNHILNSKFIFNNKKYIDYVWMEQQFDYINNLSDRQKHILRAYTKYGDEFINNFIRGTLSDRLISNLLNRCIQSNENPFLYQHKSETNSIEINDVYRKNILKYIESFIDELSNIIKNSPKLTRKIKVFRGFKDGSIIEKSLQYNKGKKFIKINDFMSTTFYLPSTTQFMNGDCCLLELTLEPNTPCILTATISSRRNEFEITTMPGIIMNYIKCTRKYALNEMDHYDTLDVFINPKNYSVPIIRMCEFSITST
jgi:hypothetical protein